MTHEGGVVSSDAAPPSSFLRRPWFVLLALVALLVVARPLVLETYEVPSGSMQPTLAPGDRIVAWKFGDVGRGDLVVFSADQAFLGKERPDRSGPSGVAAAFGIRPDTVYVKRVVGLPGDRLKVGADGVLVVNGKALGEPYLMPGVKGSEQEFDLTVPPERYFVMGDNRPVSDDSRDHLGDPGGGTIAREDVIGVVTARFWPPARIGSVN